jgi:hypothetical protein
VTFPHAGPYDWLLLRIFKARHLAADRPTGVARVRVVFGTIFVLGGVAIVASGVLGLVARTKVPDPPGRGQAVAASLRIAGGFVVLVMLLRAL